MLSEAEKEQFIPEELDLRILFEDIKRVWEKDYSWINIKLNIEGKNGFKINFILGETK